MRMPSIKSLLTLNVSPADAALIREIGRATNDGESLRRVIDAHCPHTAAYVFFCNDPYRVQCWRVTVALHAIDRILGTHGVEWLGEGRPPNYDPLYEYCNAGDPYVATLVYTRATDTLRVATWSDIAERLPVGY